VASAACAESADDGESRPVCDASSAEPTIVAIETGASHTCALLSPCGALCWGENVYGQAGADPHMPLVAAPLWVLRDYAFRELRLGNEHSCGLTSDGAVFCWGAIDFSELGSADVYYCLAPLEV
jgi:alpha-tubulin suppressor-like RCC1 family protein